jgi:hypothetical protein
MAAVPQSLRFIKNLCRKRNTDSPYLARFLCMGTGLLLFGLLLSVGRSARLAVPNRKLGRGPEESRLYGGGWPMRRVTVAKAAEPDTIT